MVDITTGEGMPKQQNIFLDLDGESRRSALSRHAGEGSERLDVMRYQQTKLQEHVCKLVSAIKAIPHIEDFESTVDQGDLSLTIFIGLEPTDDQLNAVSELVEEFCYNDGESIGTPYIMFNFPDKLFKEQFYKAWGVFDKIANMKPAQTGLREGEMFVFGTPTFHRG